LSFFFLHLATGNPGSAEPAAAETEVTFHGFSWGTSMDDVIQRMGRPVSREERNGLVSLVWEDVEMNGYTTFMLAYFSSSGLQGGTYYFLTYSMDELAQCFTELRQELRASFGPTSYYYSGIVRELRPYECAWNLAGGYIHLKTNTRQGDPVSLWYSSPELTRQIRGEPEASTARR
jgi:hypothetical protein